MSRSTSLPPLLSAPIDVDPRAGFTFDMPLLESFKFGDVVALDFDVCRVASTLGHQRTLPFVANELFQRSNLLLPETVDNLGDASGEGFRRQKPAAERGPVQLRVGTFRRWIKGVEAGYHRHPYHNSLHGCDVMCTSSTILRQCGFLVLDSGARGGDVARSWSLTHLTLLVAAASHDIAHGARTNPFLHATKHPLVALYPGTMGVLEMMHAATAHEVLSGEGQDIFGCLAVDEARWARGAVTELILATDLSRQAAVLKKWSDRKRPRPARSAAGGAAVWGDGGEGATAEGGAALWEPNAFGLGAGGEGDRLEVAKLVLKCADLSNPAKSMEVYLQWTERILSEFYAQGDEEKSLGLAVTAIPQCDRTKPDLVADQNGFISFLVRPCFAALATFLADCAAAEGAAAECAVAEGTAAESAVAEGAPNEGTAAADGTVAAGSSVAGSAEDGAAGRNEGGRSARGTAVDCAAASERASDGASIGLSSACRFADSLVASLDAKLAFWQRVKADLPEAKRSTITVPSELPAAVFASASGASGITPVDPRRFTFDEQPPLGKLSSRNLDEDEDRE